MLDFHQKRKLKALLSTRIVQGIFFVMVASVLYSAYTRFQIAAEMAERRRVEEAAVETLRQRKADLESQVQYLSDERGIEAEMRRQFDVALEGEQVVVLVDPETEAEALATPVIEEEPAWYQFWR